MKNTILIISLLFFSTGYCQNIGELYEKSKEAVVLIKTSESEVVGDGYQKLMLNVKGIGSGFVVSKDGEIMTASHVVQTAQNIIVKFSDGEEIYAEVVSSYPPADVALIKLTSVKKTPLKVVKLSNSDNVKVGDQIFVIGAPFGLGNSLSVGYVGGRYINKIDGGFVMAEVIQTDAAINEGSSGAPMFNLKGEVVGISSFILSNSKGFQGLGFATTSNIAKNILLDERSVFTGIDAHLITGTLARILNIPQEGGVLVQKVAKFSLGDMMGIEGGTSRIYFEGGELIVGGDIILSIEHIALTNQENLHKAWQLIQNLNSGDILQFTILRKGTVLKIAKAIPISILK
ncbi:serine protease Do [Lutibacter agarilyticus]|uniref:Serine protease Do n=1 Tax=Lutibacter agarilyticus TaxID=1109740 RepID=A0A238YDY2_9FLAO|nr:trypsin-like peptidase domain-containing protein [Lutibacter agarilyticus]SNR69435.1 serine protease Do [Lutibacter agarilyticus]